MLFLDKDISVYSIVNMLDLFTNLLGLIAAWCIHDNFTTIKQHYITTIIMIWISKGLTQWCLLGTKSLTEMLKYVINQALGALFISRCMVCFFSHYVIYIYTSKYGTQKFTNHMWGVFTLLFLSLQWTLNYHHQSPLHGACFLNLEVKL